MTKEDIITVLNNLYITHKKEQGKIKIDFNHGDKRIGHIYYTPREIVGRRKPIRQNVYMMNEFEMVGVLDYIHNQIPIQENDFETINKTINEFCLNYLSKVG